ncbi:MAG: peptidase S41 [Candidatus Amulumruptor caecigallinarius]|uniref:PDZ domain-containing protein n=1 Tax=Candidatus Amulumruptor caecigallinarius TaxID=2109911 RepID=A0A4Q0UB59_9BACT|nr:MAG: peptidase S41 [Candidatus Amulumruptor caecigallinarius]HJE39063.1 PDZ domain-containing protein [Candidatus Amulumruptor caecigallinarius]
MKYRYIIAAVVAAVQVMAVPAKSKPAEQPFVFSPEQKLRLTERIIENYYVDSVDMNRTVEEGIISMLRTLDPHSSYSNREETIEMTETLGGGFSGVGISFNMLRDTLFVVSTVIGGPCEKVGMLAGDRIIVANDTLMSGAGRSTSDVRKILRGPKGTTVRMKVQRQNEPELIDFVVTRDEIPIYSVDAHYMAAPGVGYIKIVRFAESTEKEVKDALKALKKQGMKRLIIDLQGNGGGYMNAAVAVAQLFLDKGDEIVYTKGLRVQPSYYSAASTGPYRDIEVVTMVDQSSASASEILAGAFQDNDRGVVIGRRTFGKGLVQRPFPFPDGSMIRLTTAHYYTPSGRSIQKPYDEGEEDYNKDLYRRLQSGELTDSTMSVAHPDSLRFTTSNGRVVYGGGGITPDIFVPLDTTRVTPYYRDLVAKGVLNRYCLQYVDSRRKQLKSDFKTVDDFACGFKVTDEMMTGLAQMAEADSVKAVPDEVAASRDYLSTIVKALIGRDLFDSSAYYQVANPLNPMYLRAVEVINDTRRMQSVLASPDYAVE